MLNAGARVECPRNIKRLKQFFFKIKKKKKKERKQRMTCGVMTCEMNNLELE